MKKLYCVNYTNENNEIIDVDHILADDDRGVHKRLDYFLDQCKQYGVEDYKGYSFSEINTVDNKKIIVLD